MGRVLGAENHMTFGAFGEAFQDLLDDDDEGGWL